MEQETYLRPHEIARKLGLSNRFVSKAIRKSKCRELKEDGCKTLFCYEDIVKYIQLGRE